MDQERKRRTRAPRSDAIANRTRIVEAAGVLFSAGDHTVSLEAVARKAGVGIGTLYRHFASRDALAAAVYHREVDELVAFADTIDRGDGPVDALRRWLRALVDFVATKKGLAEALRWSARMPADLTAYSSDRLTIVTERLLRDASAARGTKMTVEAQDLLRVVVALSYEFDQPDWQERVTMLVDVFVDGLLPSTAQGDPEGQRA